MRILYHHRTVSRDGQDVHIEEMIAALRRQGHVVRVVAPQGEDSASFGKDGGWAAWIKQMLPKAVYEALEMGYSLFAYRRLRQAYDSFQPDILYERYNLYFLAGYWLKARTGLPYVVEINSPLASERAEFGGLALRRLAEWSERTVWRGADLTLPVTDVLAEFVRRTGVTEARILVVPNGIDPQRFSPQVDSTAVRRRHGLEGKVVLGFTGFIRDWHGLPHVIDAMAAMENRAELHFLVIGDGPGRAALEEYAEARGMRDQLTTLGVVGRDHVASYVAAFDIALQPKVVAYASPLKLFEYMGLGRAIVAPDQPNIREVLRDGENALLFDPDDPAQFCRAIMLLCGDSVLRARLGAAAAHTIEMRDFTWDGNARRIVARLHEQEGRSNRDEVFSSPLGTQGIR
ncbi:glycosyltransferase family 4 protein [Magnetospirillum molischianum]|uniref:Glycosyl transferase group 1 n=1 Tax=Magnetospirillum molischianum DSM 120 TaxID=1150626 RepID=H8FQC9_MAGML|nr:glycosyltransferase family 4 protein [Magnetospirillum molischianum]CCG40567.1 Glycosyl transferase group 1 [Magnetospirillum molischianum DSM 120]